MKNFTRIIFTIFCCFAMMQSTEVKAFQGECLNYAMFMADNPLSNQGNVSTLYGVNIVDGKAVLSQIMTREFRFHIAYNGNENVVYVVKNDGTGFETIDATTGLSLGMTTFKNALGGTPTAVYKDGLLYLGSQAQKKVVVYNMIKETITDYATKVPVSGGDLIEKDGTIYLVTRNGSKLYEVVKNGGVINPVSIPSKVSGASFTANDTVLMSNKDATVLTEIDLDGNVLSTFPVELNGSVFLLRNGDMAGGCNLSSSENPNNLCKNYRMYYSDIKSNVSDIYGVSLSGNTAKLTNLATVKGKVHISYDPENDKIYAVDASGTTLTTINAGTGNIISSTPIASGLNTVVSNAYKNGKIYLASTNLDIIVELNVETGNYVTIASNIPVKGGDLVFRGMDLFLATRQGNKIIQIDTNANDYYEISSIANNVNGLALTSSGEYLMSNANTSTFKLLDADGAYIKSYNVEVNGETLNLKSGDLAAGCADKTDNPEPCETALVNGGFEIDNNLSGSWDYVPQNLVPGWSTTSAGGTIEIQANMGTGDVIPSNSGDYHFELNGDGLNTLYQGICTKPGYNLEVTFSHKKRRANGIDEMSLYVGGDLNSIESTTPVTVYSVNVDEWETKTFVFNIPEGQDYTYVYFKAVSGTNHTVGNLLDDISVDYTLQPQSDFDAYFSTLSAPVVSAVTSEIVLYPVPARDRLTIKLNSQNRGSVSYEIVSIMGQSFNRGTKEAYRGETEIATDISNLADGTYFFVMHLNGNTITKRFVKVSR